MAHRTQEDVYQFIMKDILKDTNKRPDGDTQDEVWTGSNTGASGPMELRGSPSLPPSLRTPGIWVRSYQLPVFSSPLDLLWRLH